MARCRPRPASARELALRVVERCRARRSARGRGPRARATSMPRASSSVAGREHLDAGDVRVPALEAECECCAASWRPAPVVMRITSGTCSCPPDMCCSVAALFRIWSSASRLKFTVMISTIGPHAAERGADAGADERRLRQRRVADALGPELLEQALAHREAAAVAADVLAHEEHRGRRAGARRGSPSRIASRYVVRTPGVGRRS